MKLEEKIRKKNAIVIDKNDKKKREQKRPSLSG